jgi:hypothetical protein
MAVLLAADPLTLFFAFPVLFQQRARLFAIYVVPTIANKQNSNTFRTKVQLVIGAGLCTMSCTLFTQAG